MLCGIVITYQNAKLLWFASYRAVSFVAIIVRTRILAVLDRLSSNFLYLIITTNTTFFYHPRNAHLFVICK